MVRLKRVPFVPKLHICCLKNVQGDSTKKIKSKFPDNEATDGLGERINKHFLCSAKKVLIETEWVPARATVIVLHTDMRKGILRSGPMWDLEL